MNFFNFQSHRKNNLLGPLHSRAPVRIPLALSHCNGPINTASRPLLLHLPRLLSRASDHTTALARAAATARQDVGWPAAPRRRRRFVQVAGSSSSSSSSPSSSPSSPRRRRLRPPSPSAPAPALALAPAPPPTPATVEDIFNPNPFSPGDTRAVGVLRESFNSLNETLHRLGRPPVNAPIVLSVAGYVYAIFMVAEAMRGLP